MTNNPLISVGVLCALVFSSTAYSADPDYPMKPWDDMAGHGPMHSFPGDDMDRPYPLPPAQDFQSMRFNDFPTPTELARMAPPEPITEEKIKKRFAAQRERLQEMVKEDRQAAVRYAQDFSRYQKMQSDNLVKLMARAEKRRTAILKRLDEQEQRVLERFRQRQSALTEQPQTVTEQPPSNEEKPESGM